MAIDDLLDEHEQGERVKAWLRENGVALIVGILLAFGAIFGWNKWKDHRANAQQVPGTRYQATINHLDAGKPAEAQAEMEALGEHGYRTLAALHLAKTQVDAGERDQAIATLAAIRESDPALEAVINQRHARLLLDAGKHDEALAVLGDAADGESLQVRGDIELAAGRADAARESYLKALPQVEVGSPQRNVLELKLSEVGGAPAQSEGQSE